MISVIKFFWSVFLWVAIPIGVVIGWPYILVAMGCGVVFILIQIVRDPGYWPVRLDD